MEGSINGTDWTTLYNQSSNYSYPSDKSKAFYTPAIFVFTNDIEGQTTTGATQNPVYKNIASTDFQATFTEGFQERPVLPSLSPITEGYPLLTDSKPTVAPLRLLRMKFRETHNPDSRFVHMSRILFHTKNGTIPSECIRITNPQGSRRSPLSKPDALLKSETNRRWVDYNKSELLIQFKTDTMPKESITGFQFYIPTGVDNPLDALPSKWILEGSYDGKTWITLHEKTERARFMGVASPVYNFLE
jgi:hypothetical protein